MVAALSLLIAIISIQGGASLAKQLFPLVGPTGTTTLRLFFAAMILVGVWRPWRHHFSGPQLKLMAYYGIALAGMNLMFYMSIARIPLGIAVALEFTGPLGLAIISSRKLRDFIWVALAAVGIFLVLPLSTASHHLDVIGILLALAAGLCWAFYIYFGQRAGSGVHGGYTAAIGMSISALLVLPVGLATTGTALFDLNLLPLGIAVALLSSAIPYSFEMIALKKLPTQTFSVMMSLEPAAAAFSGFLFLNEVLTLRQLLAIALIITASAGSSVTSHRRKKEILLQA